MLPRKREWEETPAEGVHFLTDFMHREDGGSETGVSRVSGVARPGRPTGWELREMGSDTVISGVMRDNPGVQISGFRFEILMCISHRMIAEELNTGGWGG